MTPTFRSVARTVWVWFRLLAGIGLVVVGIIGLFLPVLQGVLMIIAGLVILSAHFHWARWLLNYVRRRAGLRDPR